MKKIFRHFSRALILLVLVLSLLQAAGADTLNGTQSGVVGSEVVMYTPGISGSVTGASAQIGNSANADVTIRSVTEAGAGIHTYILIDNSQSILEENREKMRTVAKDLVNNHSDGEVFTVSTFNDEVNLLINASSDYNAVISVIDSIVFEEQYTHLRKALYKVLSDNKAENRYFKVVVFSDCLDDEEHNYTYEEIENLCKETKFKVISVCSESRHGVFYDNMFQVSRYTGADYCNIGEIDTSELNGFALQVQSDNPTKVACVSLPASVQDGSTQNIKVSISTDQGNFEYTSSAVMPFAAIEATTETEAAAESQTEITAEEEINQVQVISETQESVSIFAEESEKSESIITKIFGEDFSFETFFESESIIPGINYLIFCIICLVVLLLIVAAIVVLLSIRSKSKNKAGGRNNNKNNNNNIYIAPERNLPNINIDYDDNDDFGYRDDYDDERTTLLRDEIDFDDDERTILIHNDRTSPVTVTLIPENDYSNKIIRNCDSDITIGRKPECNICIKDDKSVSGRHCTISRDANSNVWIKDDNSANGTYLNDEQINTSTKLEDGDSLEIGRTRYIVKITR